MVFLTLGAMLGLLYAIMYEHKIWPFAPPAPKREALAPVSVPAPEPIMRFDWEAEYGPLFRACPSAFWLAPEPGERKRDVIDVRAGLNAQTSYLHSLAALQQARIADLQASSMQGMGFYSNTFQRDAGIFGGMFRILN